MDCKDEDVHHVGHSRVVFMVLVCRSLNSGARSSKLRPYDGCLGWPRFVPVFWALVGGGAAAKQLSCRRKSVIAATLQHRSVQAH